MESRLSSITYKNRVLASLPTEEIERLAPHLVPRVFKRNQTLHDAGQVVETVFFLESGVCSIVVTLEDGRSVEVERIVGRESYVGMPAVLGMAHPSATASFIQVAGTGYAVKSKILMAQSKDGSGRLHECLERGIQGQYAQAAQSAACNRMHELEARLARWLLMCRDLVGGDEVHMTHEFLTVMLGTRRNSVTVAGRHVAERPGWKLNIRGEWCT